jgi:Flavin containing amine oxidoreductase
MKLYDEEREKFLKAVEDVVADLDMQWASSHELYNDPGVIAKLAEHGWVVGTDNSLISNTDSVIQWDYLDWEFTQKDTSVRYFSAEEDEQLFTADQRGFDFLLQTYFQQNANTANLVTGTRVLLIAYDETIVGPTGKTYKAKVNTHNGVECTDYIAQRVISTLSSGVLNAGIVQFQPPLKYPEPEYNPMEAGQFVKIFYQFSTQFWENEEFIRVVPNSLEDRGACNNWQNMAYFMPGSNIVRYVTMLEFGYRAGSSLQFSL